MSEPTNKVEQKKEYTTQEFVTEYQKLCEQMGYQIVVNPAYVARDDGSFSTVLQTSVGKLPKKQV